MNLAQARAFLEARRGDQYGEMGVALNIVLPYAATRFEAIEGQAARLERDLAQARTAAAHDRQRVHDLAVAVQAALHSPDAHTFAAVVRTISRLPAVRDVATEPPLEQLGRAPRPTPNRRTA